MNDWSIVIRIEILKEPFYLGFNSTNSLLETAYNNKCSRSENKQNDRRGVLRSNNYAIDEYIKKA